MRGRKYEYCPESLVKHIERELKEINKENPTRIEAMEKIAEELDKLVIKRNRRLKL
jgi:DNA topoisomerase IA